MDKTILELSLFLIHFQHQTMKKLLITILLFSTILSNGCIGDDVVDDFIEPVLRITQSIDTLGVDDSFGFQARFFNNVGQEEMLAVQWICSDETIASIDNNGRATGLQTGEVNVRAEVTYQEQIYADEQKLVISMETVDVPNITERFGTIATTSSYVLEGDFTLKNDDGVLKLIFEDNYVADQNLPGLYVYLTNNPNTNSGALEIGKVNTFNGAHTYEVPGNPDILEYQYVLYYCKPFSVKVGDGLIGE